MLRSQRAADQSRACQRTDSVGTAEFQLPDPVPETINIVLVTNGLVECYAPRTFALADAMKSGVVAKNTCGDASTNLTELVKWSCSVTRRTFGKCCGAGIKSSEAPRR